MFSFFSKKNGASNQDFSHVSLIVSDMDGTLLNNNGDVYDSTVELIKDLQKHNVTFMVASGRWHSNVKEIYEVIGIESDIISLDGALTKSSTTNHTLHTQGISRTILQRIMELVTSKTLDVTLITAEDLICNNDLYLPTYLTPSMLNVKPLNMDVVSDIDVLRIYIKGNRAAIESLHFTLQQTDILSEVKIYLRESKHESGYWYLEIRTIKANKGTALQRYMVEHSINKHNTIGIGDYRNDMSLLQSCGYKVALANGVAELREIADYVTLDSSDDGGIDEILERVLLSVMKR